MTAKAKEILRNLRGATISRRWIGFSEDDANFTAEGADIRLRSRSYQRVEDNGFHHLPAPATDEAEEWGEVSVADLTLVWD